MKLSDIIEDLHALDIRLLTYEKQYGLHSSDFYTLYQQGALDGGELEATVDFTRWAGLYEIQQERESLFRRISSDFVEALRAQSSGEAIRLMPNPALVA